MIRARAGEPRDVETIARRIARLREDIAAAAARAGRSPEDILLVAVTKRVDAARIREAMAAGIADFGENYIQEAAAKIAQVGAVSGTLPRWHMIGHLQSNKAKTAVELFSLVHSVDNPKLVKELGKHAQNKGKVQPVLIEVNIAQEPQRAGVLPAGTPGLAEQIQGTPGLLLQGLMGMAPVGEKAEDARPYFAQMRTLFEKLPAENRHVLSMGMSGDFSVAVEEGATLVRIGTAVFGRRGE